MNDKEERDGERKRNLHEKLKKKVRMEMGRAGGGDLGMRIRNERIEK